MNETDSLHFLSVSPWDTAPRSVGIIRDIGRARPVIARRLLSSVGNLQEEFAVIRKDDERIVAKLTNRLRAKYTYHTNAIEGNTLTESETRSFIETGMTVSGKPLKDYTEAKNIPRALDMLIDMAGEKRLTLKIPDILDIHRVVVSGIEEASPGYFRRGFVRIGTSTYIPPPAYEIEPLTNEMVEYVNKNSEKLTPLEMAFKVHLWFVSIHPFDDGNGRVARLLAGLILMKNKMPPQIIKNDHKSKYLRVLRQTQSKDGLKPYYDFMSEEYISTLVEYISLARQRDARDNLVPLADAAKRYNMDVEYLSLLARNGTISAIKNGGRWMVRVKDIRDYISRRNMRFSKRARKK